MEQFIVDRLRESLHDRVVTPSDPDYDTARATFNATVQRWPAVIVRVRDDADVIARWSRRMTSAPRTGCGRGR